jgi:hypothetical protein
MYKKVFPQYNFGKTQKGWLHSKLPIVFYPCLQSNACLDLEEVSEMIGVPFVTQSMLKSCNPASRDEEYAGMPMRHNAAGDVLMTLIAFIEILRYKGLDLSSTGDWNLMAYDL